MRHQHLTDDELIMRCAGGAAPQEPDDAAHGCRICQDRLQALARLLRDVTETAAREADAVFPPERRARQYARILHRIEHHGQPGRVLAFPNANGRRTAMPVTPMRRWVAAAAAAGLAIGLVAGRYSQDVTVVRERTISERPAEAEPDVPRLRAAATMTDDEFIRELEYTLSSGPAGLRRLEGMTPVAWAWGWDTP
jgi:hypothetical protein